jgi:hypothetical protein
MQMKLLGTIIMDFDVTGPGEIMYSAFVRVLRKSENKVG